MRYALSMNFEGSVRIESETVECRILGLAGSGGPPESTEPWQIAVQFAWSHADDDEALTAQVEIQNPLAGVLNGVFRSGRVDTLTDQQGEGQACALQMAFDLSGSSGSLAGARGAMRLSGTVMPCGFLLTVDLDLNAPAGAWIPLNSSLLSEAEAASGGSHVGARLLTAPSQHGDRILRRGAAPEMTFDLSSELEQLHGERGWITGERNAKTLVREPDFRVVLTAMHAGTRLAQHDAVARITIQTVQGHLRVVLPDRVVDLPADHLLTLDRNVRHEVEAVEDGAFLLTLAWPGARGDRDA